MSDDIAFMPVTELVAAFRAKSVTPTQAMRAALDRISAHDDRVNGICYLDEEGALAAAAESDARWERGAPKGLVDGVPISVKDTLNVKGMPTRQGSKTADPNPVAADAAAVARMREHGAIIFGKNTTPEYGTGPSTVNPLTGVTRNPWNLDKSPGGSSGGAAAVVAAGIGQASLGTDAGGSIRIPCALCGLVGLKTTLARVAVYPPMVVPVLSTTGALARTVDDAELMLNVLSQRDGRDFQELAPDGVDYTRGLNDGIRGLRVAYSATLGFAPRVDFRGRRHRRESCPRLYRSRRHRGREGPRVRRPARLHACAGQRRRRLQDARGTRGQPGADERQPARQHRDGPQHFSRRVSRGDGCARQDLRSHAALS